MRVEAEATLKEAKEHGLSEEEFERVVAILDRNPNMVELGIFSVLWSEHCSYKSSKIHLRKFPTSAPWVMQGPGENAGIVDIGEGWAAAFKMESHNHPSFIEPFQGAATGVGGILRDVFTMGARPIACLDSLRFGHVDAERMRYLVDGVVGGIASYGNCMGIPTVGGETTFYSAYDKNILVNAFTCGIVRHENIFRAFASGPGNPVIYVGSKTGRDGIHGATMASEEFDKDSEAKRPNVQVGDPFTEKLLMEACLELMQGDAVVGIQDMGAAGLTSSSFEMCGRAGTGMSLDLDRVPLREQGMNPYEIMLSESQERMLLVAQKGREEDVMQIFRHWGLDAVIIGEVTDDGYVRATWKEEEVLAIPADPLSTESPMYDRPVKKPDYIDDLNEDQDLDLSFRKSAEDDILSFLKNINHCSKRWIWRQYDHMVRVNTVLNPGLGASVLRVKDTDRALALTSDVNPLYCYLDPREGAIHAVAEGALNLACVGAHPLGLTDCLNFGNPEKPEIMWQFVEAVEGMAHACRELDIPVVSGNVSFYNETEGEAIWPTPTVAMVGLVDSLDNLPAHRLDEGRSVYIAGGGEYRLSGSEYAYSRGHLRGRIPRVDLTLVRHLVEFLCRAYHEGAVAIAHDISSGGLLMAAAELCSFYQTGMVLDTIPDGDLATALFGEGCGRILIVSKNDQTLQSLAAESGLNLVRAGKSGGERMNLQPAEVSLSIHTLTEALEGALPGLMES